MTSRTTSTSHTDTDSEVYTVSNNSSTDGSDSSALFTQFMLILEEKAKSILGVENVQTTPTQINPKDDNVKFHLNFPELTISNAVGHSRKIKDLTVQMTFEFNPYSSVHKIRCMNIKGKRRSLAFDEFISGYRHSHLHRGPTISVEGSSGRWFSPFCLDELHESIQNLVSQAMVTDTTDDIEVIAEALIYQFETAMSWESLEGGPFMQLCQIEQKVTSVLTAVDLSDVIYSQNSSGSKSEGSMSKFISKVANKLMEDKALPPLEYEYIRKDDKLYAQITGYDFNKCNQFYKEYFAERGLDREFYLYAYNSTTDKFIQKPDNTGNGITSGQLSALREIEDIIITKGPKTMGQIKLALGYKLELIDLISDSPVHDSVVLYPAEDRLIPNDTEDPYWRLDFKYLHPGIVAGVTEMLISRINNHVVTKKLTENV